MKKRLAKKAFSIGYYNLWIKPETNKTFLVPRNARCWYIIQKTFHHYGHPEWIDKLTASILKTATE